jgi:hypothetical protein
MPTLNPRVNVTLSPSLDALVGQLAGFERVSKSQVLRELLETAEPALRHAVALMEAAKGASVKARANLAKDLDSSVKAAEGVSELLLRELSNQTRDMVSEAEAVRGRRPSRSSALARASVAPAPARPGQNNVRRSRKDPPSSNRGVK